MQIHGAHVHGPSPIGPPHTSGATHRPLEPTAPAQIQDELDLSPAALTLEQIRNVPAVRQDRINQIRAQIANGTYETPEKLDIALERLLDEIG